ncbi:MAG TPA: hypothetical protein PKW21_01590 [Rhabdaerophilum sp.]|nr:hypothetical protein [Rhabdaerophilum sp.]
MADNLEAAPPPPRWATLLPWLLLWVAAPAPLWLALVLTFVIGVGR